MPKDNLPRAYYIGAISVGGPLIKVKILRAVENEPSRFYCEIVSTKSAPWHKGERVYCNGSELRDRAWKTSRGVVSEGGEWRYRLL